MNLPNLLTLFRLFLIPLYVSVFVSNKDMHLLAAFIFVLASATDVLDGYLARKLNLSTKVGQLLDPLADKCMQIAVIITLFSAGLVPVWFIALLIAKEVIMILGGIFLYSKKTYVKSNAAGKINTVFLFLVMTLLLVFPTIDAFMKNILLGLSTALALYTGATYIYVYFVQNQQFKIYTLLHNKKGEPR